MDYIVEISKTPKAFQNIHIEYKSCESTERNTSQNFPLFSANSLHFDTFPKKSTKNRPHINTNTKNPPSARK